MNESKNQNMLEEQPAEYMVEKNCTVPDIDYPKPDEVIQEEPNSNTLSANEEEEQNGQAVPMPT